MTGLESAIAIDVLCREPDSVAQNFSSASRMRRHEPVTIGVPLPRGFCRNLETVGLRDDASRSVPCQLTPLDRWPDGSIRWALLDFQATIRREGGARYYLGREGVFASPTFALKVDEQDHAISIETGALRASVRLGGRFPFESVRVGGNPAIDASRSRLQVETASGAQASVRISGVSVEEAGPLRAVVLVKGSCRLLELEARLHFFAGSATVRFELTLRNPRKAGHPGGKWLLGGKGSVYVRDVSLTFALPRGCEPGIVRCSPERGHHFAVHPGPIELYQDSSGGENWRSPNHRNREGRVPHEFRGYRLQASDSERFGLRAAPVVVLRSGDWQLAVTMPQFWQNFPKAIEADEGAVRLRLFPRQSADVHEIQGGEQKTHRFAVAFGPDRVTDLPLDWCRAPIVARVDPAWCCASGAVPYLMSLADDPNVACVSLAHAAIDGDDTFERKRETIDEYGWRHFGDIYADHENVGHQGATALVSHYNNQYDAIAGFGYQFLRSGDARWWNAMDELAAHVVDIDIYHTTRDKAAYNGGLFWHTQHYLDAGLSTHRTYPDAPGVTGGGPSAEHNYTTGLMLHYFLTGSVQSRDAAIGLARWVLNMDDGRQTVFRWLDRGETGLASNTASPLYHGPGRGAGNSINALLDAHRLTSQAAFLAKAEAIVRRCIHPQDDLTARGLSHPEQRWSYTAFLQVLGKYLDYKAELGQIDEMYTYARESLLHYARWMAEHEYPYLEKPELLEHPTETWAAQELRKTDVFDLATRHTTGQECARFQERAEFFFRDAVETLSTMPTRTLTRPVVLMICFGSRHAFFQKHRDIQAPAVTDRPPLPPPVVFLPQRQQALARAKRLGAGAVAASLLLLSRLLSGIID